MIWIEIEFFIGGFTFDRTAKAYFSIAQHDTFMREGKEADKIKDPIRTSDGETMSLPLFKRETAIKT